jgi:hypothetical protein
MMKVYRNSINNKSMLKLLTKHICAYTIANETLLNILKQQFYHFQYYTYSLNI